MQGSHNKKKKKKKKKKIKTTVQKYNGLPYSSAAITAVCFSNVSLVLFICCGLPVCCVLKLTGWLKPNSITLASLELAPNMFGASSELAPNQLA